MMRGFERGAGDLQGWVTARSFELYYCREQCPTLATNDMPLARSLTLTVRTDWSERPRSGCFVGNSQIRPSVMQFTRMFVIPWLVY